MAPYYDKPLQISNNIGFSMPAVTFNGKPNAVAMNNGFAPKVSAAYDSYGYTSNPLNVSAEKIQLLVQNNSRLREIVENELCGY